MEGDKEDFTKDDKIRFSIVKAEEFIDDDDESPVGVHAVVFGT